MKLRLLKWGWVAFGVALLIVGPPLVLILPALFMLGTLFIGVIAMAIVLAMLVQGCSKFFLGGIQTARSLRHR